MRLDKRKEYFDYIKGVNIDKKRNMVVHSSARRPSLKDVGSYEKLANAVIWLGQYLEIEDSIDIQNDRLTY